MSEIKTLPLLNSGTKSMGSKMTDKPNLNLTVKEITIVILALKTLPNMVNCDEETYRLLDRIENKLCKMIAIIQKKTHDRQAKERNDRETT
jgi:hypothetical protein